MRGGFAPSLRRNATAEACNTAAPPGLVSPGGAATVGKQLPDGEMTFAIPVFVHPSNEYTMLWGGHPILKNAPRRLGGALRTTGVAAPGCAITRLTRRWRADCHKRRRLTDKPPTMPRPNHAAIDQARANARGAFILGDSELTLPAMGCVPATLLCRDAGAMLPFGEDHTQRRPWLVVNPGEATATPRA